MDATLLRHARPAAKFGFVDDLDAEFAGLVELGAGLGTGDEPA
jgi:hypothetical protein